MARKTMIAGILTAALLVANPSEADAQSTNGTAIPHGQFRPPNPPRGPLEAARAMTVPPGFTVEVVASEPELVNPTAMTFDEQGRIWVTESVEYPRRAKGKGRDRVKVFQDEDGDGRAERVTVFADGLNIPSGVAVGHGGVWVANAPDILLLRDTDGDSVADTREVVATGFGRDDVHELPNSLTWGPDGWLYGWNGVFNSSRVKSKNGKTYEFTCAIFRIHPRTRVFEVWCEGTSNPWGIAINPDGSFFSSACVIDHLWHLVETGYYIRQGGPYPPFTWPIGSITHHTHQQAAYCGIHYFDSPAYPAEYRGRLYMGNIHAGAINVDRVVSTGASYGSHPEQDFLTANDAWFMPVSQKTGPDGSLYILDWYDRYHCYQDANRDPQGIDRDKGRLYRVRYGNTPRRAPFDLAKSRDDDLITLLGDANVYNRDTAQRLLAERATPAIRAKLETLALDPRVPGVKQSHALWALLSSGPLREEFHLALLERLKPNFQALAVRAAGDMRNPSPRIRDKVAKLARDPFPEIRLQVAIASRKIEGVDPIPLLLDVLETGDDGLVTQIVWRNLEPFFATRPSDLAKRIEGRQDSPGFSEIAPKAIERTLALDPIDTGMIRAWLEHTRQGQDTLEALGHLVDYLESKAPTREFLDAMRADLVKFRDRPTATPVHQNVVALYQVALALCGDRSALKDVFLTLERPTFKDQASDLERESIRREALESLLKLKVKGLGKVTIPRLLLETDSRSTLQFRRDVLAVAGRLDDPEIASAVLAVYPKLADPLKPAAIDLLCQRAPWGRSLLEAVDRKTIPAIAIGINQLRRLKATKDPAIQGLITKLYGALREERRPDRDQVVSRMRELVSNAPGDAPHGRAVFAKLCGQCHKLHGEGQEVGPDLTGVGRSNLEQLLSNVFDPNLVIGPGYQATTVAGKDGRILSGLLIENGGDRVILKLQGGRVETIARDQVDDLKTSQVSLMPEGIETQLSPNEVVDLFAYLREPDPSPRKPPGRP